MEAKNIFFKPDECKFMALACLDMLRIINENKQHPWTPEARKIQKEMLEAGNRVRDKFKKLGFNMSELEELLPGEELDWLTKES